LNGEIGAEHGSRTLSNILSWKDRQSDGKNMLVRSATAEGISNEKGELVPGLPELYRDLAALASFRKFNKMPSEIASSTVKVPLGKQVISWSYSDRWISKLINHKGSGAVK